MRAAPEAVNHLPDAACRCVSEDISGSRQESKDAIVRLGHMQHRSLYESRVVSPAIPVRSTLT